jgi:hypothetical protein
MGLRLSVVDGDQLGKETHVFIPDQANTRKAQRKLRKGKPVETAATVEIRLKKRADSHSCLDKTERRTCSVLSTVTTGSAAVHKETTEKENGNRGAPRGFV